MTVMVIFGGVTTEHDVSIVTAAQAMAVMNGIGLLPVYVGRDGVWRYDRRFTTIEGIKSHRGKKVHLRPSDARLYCGSRAIKTVDAVLSCMHGLHGEDGSAAVWAQTSGIPYTCSDLAGSAVGMDKILTKYFLRGAKIPVVNGFSVRRGENATDLRERCALNYPVVVKPSRLGSSIGIAMAHNDAELTDAVEVALCYDERVLIEAGIVKRKEYNCAAIGSFGAVTIGDVEEVGGMDEVLSFADKYLRGGKVQGMDQLARRIPAELPKKLAQQIETYTRRIFDALDLSGVVRIDFLFDEENKKLYVNEINVVPGSLAYYLFPTKGMRGVVEQLLSDAFARKEVVERRITDFHQELTSGKGGK